jgi:hypothetical protein
MTTEIDVLLSSCKIDDIRNLFLSVENLDLKYIDSWVQKLSLKKTVSTIVSKRF